MSLQLSIGARRWLLVCGGALCTGLLGLTVAVPQFLAAIQRSLAKRTPGEMQAIGAALQAYYTDYRVYPVVASRQPVTALTPYLAPTYIRALPTVDSWNGPYLVVCTSQHYEVWSLGADGQVGPNTADGNTTSLNDDILLRDGQFVRYPHRIWP